MEENKKTGKQIILHIVLLAAIILIAVISIYRLYEWTKGTPSDAATADVDPSQFYI